MTKYRIYIQKEVYETYDIEANSEDEALESLNNAFKVGESEAVISKSIVVMDEIKNK